MGSKQMSFTSSLLEMLTYVAPGLLVLYSMRHQFKEVEGMIVALSGPSGGTAAIPLLLIALAMGVMVAGVASLLFGLARRLPILNKKYPTNINWAALFRYSAEQLQLVRHSNQTDQAYQNMAFALNISWVFLGISLFVEGRQIEHGQLMFWVNVIFAVAMTLAAIRYNLRMFQFMAMLAENAPQNAATAAPPTP
jgi:hypothetical protein